MNPTEVTNKLRTAKQTAWSKLQPAFDYAIYLAEQAEFVANRSNKALAHTTHPKVEPFYPRLVLLLAESMDYPEPENQP